MTTTQRAAFFARVETRRVRISSAGELADYADELTLRLRDAGEFIRKCDALLELVQLRIRLEDEQRGTMPVGGSLL